MPLPAPDDLKSCCATFYEDPLLRALLGGVLHPGGLRTTANLAHQLNLGANEMLLDVACGPGQSARYLAETVGCQVTAIDYSVRSVTETRECGGGRVRCVVGDGERLPFPDASFDAVIIECSLCLFADKVTAVREMARVLRPGGRIGVADLALEQSLPSGLPEALAWTACLAGAQSTAAYFEMLQTAGFVQVTTADESWALADLVRHLGQSLLIFEVATRLGKLPTLSITPAQAREWLEVAQTWVARGLARYLLLSGQRPRCRRLEDACGEPDPIVDEVETAGRLPHHPGPSDDRGGPRGKGLQARGAEGVREWRAPPSANLFLVHT